MNKEYRFSLLTKSIPVTLQGEDKKEQHYLLKEMTAAARDRYVERLASRMGVDAAGRPALKKFDGMQADLLVNCMVFIQDDNVYRSVTAAEVQSWPGSVVADLFMAAQELNHLAAPKDEKESEPKND